MSYIGRQNLGGAYRQLDDISSGFDGSDTTHTMQVNSQNVTVGDVNQIILSLGGVIQNPGTDFTVSGSTLTFTTAPASSTSFFAILLGSDNGGTVTPTDGSVTGDKIASNLAIATNVSITTADNTDTLTLISTDADASGGPVLDFYRNSSSPADSDTIGKISFRGRNDNSEDVDYGMIDLNIVDASDGTEDGSIFVRAMRAGTLTEFMRFDPGSGGIVINDGAADINFRVENDAGGNLLNVQAVNTPLSSNTNGCVGINSANSDGNMFEVIHPTAGTYAARLESSASSGGVYALNVKLSGQSPDDNSSAFIVANDAATVRFRVYVDGDVQNHDNSYGATSDERIKQQVADASSQWDDIKAVKVRKFKYNSDVTEKGDSDDLWRLGVVAQELEASGMNGLVKPEVLYTADDQEVAINKTAKEGDIKDYKTVKYSILYMKAIKALQEAMAKIETLEADVKTLKGE